MFTKPLLIKTSTPPNIYIAATGGTETFSGSYKLHTFTVTGSSNFQILQTSSINNNIEYLVVAGGGGGGGGSYSAGSGGGGGGQVITGSITASIANFGMVVGAGGAAGFDGFPKTGVSGTTSSIFNAFVIANPGTGGFGSVTTGSNSGGASGGGFSGGVNTYVSGGGGGGAGNTQNGLGNNDGYGGYGGSGTTSTISGTSLGYGGGGGGGESNVYASYGPSSGSDGGANGCGCNFPIVCGGEPGSRANSGGGGGGGKREQQFSGCGNGGSVGADGIIIVKYQYRE